jgi:hypothetical protein
MQPYHFQGCLNLASLNCYLKSFEVLIMGQLQPSELLALSLEILDVIQFCKLFVKERIKE